MDRQRRRQAQRAGLEQAKKDMELVRSIGGTHIAAPPAGATKDTNINLLQAAERYRALLDLGASLGVIPQLEVWGFSTTLSRLGETMLVATESRHPKACVLLDVYHLYKGGSEFDGLRLLSGAAMNCFHMNDYPATPPRETITDADRVYPGDGVAPLTPMLRDLFATGFRGTLSLELFNPNYWKQDALGVARTGLEKMKEAVAKALVGNSPPWDVPRTAALSAIPDRHTESVHYRNQAVDYRIRTCRWLKPPFSDTIRTVPLRPLIAANAAGRPVILMSDLHHECGIAAIYHLPGEEHPLCPEGGPGRNLAAVAADAARHSKPRPACRGDDELQPDAATNFSKRTRKSARSARCFACRTAARPKA